MPTSTLNIILDIILIAASVWMVIIVRGLGGVIGKGLNLIMVGAVILGIAHLLATVMHNVMPMDSPTEGFIHRIIVLVGFIVLVVGFRQINTINK